MSSAALRAAATAALEAGIAARITPGGQLSVRYRDGSGAWRGVDLAAGALSYEPAAPPVALDTPYDLASVTKALMGLCAMRAVERGELELEAKLARYVPESAGHHAGAASIEALLSHRAELPAWQPFYAAVTPAQAEAGDTHATIIAQAARTAREPAEGAARYSDVGFILVGEALARATGRTLAGLIERELSAPLGLEPALHFRGVTAAFRDVRVAPTEDCAWRGRVVQGNVHDENAYALEGRSAHAGLFGNARVLADVGAACLRALDGEAAWLQPETVRDMIRERPGGSHRVVFDGKSPAGSSAGTLTGPRTFGHLGFTGTSLWCDPDARVAVALVTNRVHPSRDNPAIRAMRIAVHDAVMAALRT